MQHPVEKITDFLRDFQCLALEVYPEQSNGIRDHLVVSGFLERTHNSQVTLDFRKSLVDAELTIETIFKKTLNLEAVTRIEEREGEPKVAVL